MTEHLRRPIAVAIYCVALAWTSASVAASDTYGSPSRSDRTAAAGPSGGQPTAGGNSAEPERTKKGSGAVGKTTGHDDRTVPNPKAGKDLPTGGGNSAEPDKTGKSATGAAKARPSDARSGAGTVPNQSSTKPIPSGGGNSAEPERTGKSK